MGETEEDELELLVDEETISSGWGDDMSVNGLTSTRRFTDSPAFIVATTGSGISECTDGEDDFIEAVGGNGEDIFGSGFERLSEVATPDGVVTDATFCISKVRKETTQIMRKQISTITALGVVGAAFSPSRGE